MYYPRLGCRCSFIWRSYLLILTQKIGVGIVVIADVNAGEVVDARTLTDLLKSRDVVDQTFPLYVEEEAEIFQEISSDDGLCNVRDDKNPGEFSAET